MASNWNACLERLLAADLTNEEHRLALTLMRLLLGWRKTSDRLGEQLIRETAGLHGRSIERARAGLVSKGLILYQPGSPGRGHGAVYSLRLDEETPAGARAIRETETPALERAISSDVNPRAQSTETPALERGPIGRKERTSGASAPTPTIQTQAVDAYRGSGGTLTLERERGALARQTTQLAKAGVPDHIILAAARDLGRTHDFPGLLKQRAAEIQARGGPCKWDGLDRSALTLAQLEQCDCRACDEWAATKRAAITVTA